MIDQFRASPSATWKAMKFDLDSLRVLDAVVKAGTFSEAARRLHRTQSAVSYGINKLERQLELELFDRSGHRAELTDAGRAILDEGRALLSRARQMESMAHQLSENWEAKLEVIIDGILPIDPILGVLKDFADQEIPTRIQVKMEFLGGVQYRFDRDDADLMVVKDYAPSSGLRATALSAVEVVLVCSREHPLADVDAEEPADRQTLHEHVELTVQDSSPSGRADTRMFGGPRVFYLSDFHAKKAALLAGLGYGWMPLYMICDELDREELVEFPYREVSRYDFTPMAVHRIDRPLGRAGTRFIETLKEAVQ